MKCTDRRAGACDRVVVPGGTKPTLAAEEKGGVGAETGGDGAAGGNRRLAQRIPSGRRP